MTASAIDLAASLLLCVGSFFTLVGGIGLLRLPDFFMRLHAPTKATTLGVGGVLLASMLELPGGAFTLRELLITAFLFITAPISAYLMAQAGLRRRLASRAPLPQIDAAMHGNESAPHQSASAGSSAVDRAPRQ